MAQQPDGVNLMGALGPVLPPVFCDGRSMSIGLPQWIVPPSPCPGFRACSLQQNTKRLLAKGGREFDADIILFIVLHGGWLLALFLRSQFS